MNLPNKITLSRICLIPIFVVLFYLDVLPYHHLFAAVIFVVAASTDFLDGHIARSRGLVTDLGKFLDPIADKVLVSTAMILLLTEPSVFEVGVFAGWGTMLAGLCVAVILARELIVSGFRIIAAGKDVVLAADRFGKIKTTLQDAAIAVLLVSSSFLTYAAGGVAAIVGIGLLAACTVATIGSGINYIVKNRSILKEEKKTDNGRA